MHTRKRRSKVGSAPEILPPVRIAVSGPEAGERAYLMERPFAIIGRSPDCDIYLDDARVSYRHACLQSIGGHILCVDLCSRSGILWEDASRGSCWLRAGRTAHIGSYELRREHVAADTATPDELPADDKPLEKHAAGQVPLPGAHLEALQGDLPSPRWPLDRMLTLVGRSKGCTLRLKNESLSSVHCSLLLTTKGLFVTDLLGRGGTLVDGNPTRYARLEDGAILEIGDFRLRVRLEQQPVTESLPASPGETFPVPGAEFHRVFRLEQRGSTLIMTLLGDATRFHYADVHRESNAARFMLLRPQIADVIIDFGGHDVISSVSISSVVAIARTATDKQGRAVLCHVNERTTDVLATMHIDDLWPIVSTRDDAFAAIDA